MAPPPLAAADPPAVDDNADAGSPLLQQPGIDSINAPGQVKRYFTCLLAMMRHKDGINYPKSKVFTVDELAAVRPEHVARYFCKRVFGTETPTQNSIPTKRKTTVSYWKKGISYFRTSKAHLAHTPSKSMVQVGFGSLKLARTTLTIGQGGKISAYKTLMSKHSWTGLIIMQPASSAKVV